MLEQITKQAIAQAIKRKGSREGAAKALGITRQGLQRWELSGRVPAGRVLAMEELSGVSRYELRPDIYGEPPRSSGRAA